jgi:hypothetical protein
MTALLAVIAMLHAAALAPASQDSNKASEVNNVTVVEKEGDVTLPMPMNYKAWTSLSPEMKKAYAAVTVDALKWSYLFNDCDPLTIEEMTKGIGAGHPKDPVMIAVASTAYRMCQN